MNYIYASIDPQNVDYIGESSATADVVVDNEARTIKCDVHSDVVGFDIRKTLPKDAEGNYVTGDYTLTVVIRNNTPTFIWSSTAAGHIYYGVTDADVLNNAVISSLKDGGTTKETKECVFTNFKQRSVFAYPETFGRLSSIRHKETGLEVLSGWTEDKVIVNNLLYYVYSTGKTTGTYTYIFTF